MKSFHNMIILIQLLEKLWKVVL